MNTKLLSYKDWLKEFKLVGSEETSYNLYLDYVNKWNDERFSGETTAELTADEYRSFLLDISVLIKDPRVSEFLKEIDYNNKEEVKTIIPFFSSGLKDIASYISKTREDAKFTNTRYSYLNSNRGIKLDVYKSLISKFIIDNDLLQEDLEDEIRGLSIAIEEIYDDDEYLDKSANKTASDYFDTASSLSLYEGQDADSLDWTIGSGFIDTVSNNDAINPKGGITEPDDGMDYIDYMLPSDPDLTKDPETNVYWTGKLGAATVGEDHFVISSIDGEQESYLTVDHPWRNLGNRYFATIASVQLTDNIYTKYEKGGYNLPMTLGMPMALGRNKIVSNDPDISDNHYPSPTFYSNGYSFTKEFQLSPVLHDSYLNWINVRSFSGNGKGILSNRGTYQEMTPYQTTYESTKSTTLGISRVDDELDPWTGTEDNIWEDDANYPSDFRKIYDIDAWYDDRVIINGVEDRWGVDIYGNNYALYKDDDNDNLFDRALSGGTLVIRDVVGAIECFSGYFEDSIGDSLTGMAMDDIRVLNVYNDLVYIEDVNAEASALRIEFKDDDYIVKGDGLASTLALTDDLSSSHFGHFYDDRTDDLYLARYTFDEVGTAPDVTQNVEITEKSLRDKAKRGEE